MKTFIKGLTIVAVMLFLFACGQQQQATGPLHLDDLVFGSGNNNLVISYGTGTVNVPITATISGFAQGMSIQYNVTLTSGANVIKGTSDPFTNPSSLTKLTYTQTYAINTNLLTRGTSTYSIYLSSSPTNTSNTLIGTLAVN